MSTTDTLAALRAWATTQPQDTQLVAETLADQVEALDLCPDSDLLHGRVMDSLGKLERVQ